MFGAGDLSAPEPYGLTSAEKVIVKNKKALNENEKRIKKVDSQLNELSERIDGLESIFEGDGQKLNSVYKKFNLHIEEYKSYKEENDIVNTQLNQQLEKFKQETNEKLNQLDQKIKSNTENIRLLKNSFDKIVALVNDINSKYVTKKEFESLIKLLDKKEKQQSKKKTAFSKPKSQLMTDARNYFKKDYFTKAIPLLEYLIKNNYRPAECNYYMGEIKYYRKKYDEALSYFKTSMMLYDKASYLPKLLLHSAISFEKIGDNNNAQNFYNTLVEVYPNTKEAKIAQRKIK